MALEKVCYEILRTVKDKGGETTVEEIEKTLNLDHSAVMRNLLSLEQKNLVQTFELRKSFYGLTEEGKKYVEEGLPERNVVKTVVSLGGKASLKEIVEHAGIPEDLANIAIGWIVRKGWGQILREDETVKIEAKTIPEEGEDEKLLHKIFVETEVTSEELNPEQVSLIGELKRRKLVSEKVFSIRIVKLTEVGLAQLEKEVEVKPEVEVTALTSELIVSGKWREVKFKEYNVTATPPVTYPGKKHFYLEFL
ncbi:hypothetical protein DRO26_02635, partial [Candidatus Bathyarchaeota archaeon]